MRGRESLQTRCLTCSWGGQGLLLHHQMGTSHPDSVSMCDHLWQSPCGSLPALGTEQTLPSPSRRRRRWRGSWRGPGTHTWESCCHPPHTPCRACSGGSGRGLQQEGSKVRAPATSSPPMRCSGHLSAEGRLRLHQGHPHICSHTGKMGKFPEAHGSPGANPGLLSVATPVASLLQSWAYREPRAGRGHVPLALNVHPGWHCPCATALPKGAPHCLGWLKLPNTGRGQCPCQLEGRGGVTYSLQQSPLHPPWVPRTLPPPPGQD